MEFSGDDKKGLDINIHISNRFAIIRIDNRSFFITMIFTFIAANFVKKLKLTFWEPVLRQSDPSTEFSLVNHVHCGASPGPAL